MDNQDNIPLHVVAQPRIRWQEEAGQVVLLTPRFDKQGMINRLMRSIFGEGTLPIKLDELGSFVWKRCDGRTTLEEMIQALEESFSDQAEKAEARIRMFLNHLYLEGWIEYFVPEEKL